VDAPVAAAAAVIQWRKQGAGDRSPSQSPDKTQV